MPLPMLELLMLELLADAAADVGAADVAANMKERKKEAHYFEYGWLDVNLLADSSRILMKDCCKVGSMLYQESKTAKFYTIRYHYK